MNHETIITASKKIVKLIFAVKAISLCVKVAIAVKDCIPKYDTIENIDTDLLIKMNNEK